MLKFIFENHNLNVDLKIIFFNWFANKSDVINLTIFITECYWG